MTIEEYNNSKKVAFSFFKKQHAYDRFNDDVLDHLHSQAWIDLLQWKDNNDSNAWLSGKLLAKAMHFLYIKAIERAKHQKVWHEKFFVRLDTHRYNRMVVNDLLERAKPEVRKIDQLRLKGAHEGGDRRINGALAKYCSETSGLV